MSEARFWEAWPPVYQRIGFALLLLLVVAAGFLGYYRITGDLSIISWEDHYHQEAAQQVVHRFSKGPFEFAIPADAYYTFVYFGAGPIVPNATAGYLFVIMLALAVAVLVTVITTLDRFWFLVGMALLILFIVSLRTEVLRMPGWDMRLPTIATIVIYGLAAYYVHAIKPATGLLIRFALFLALSVVYIVCCIFLSRVEYTVLHLSVTLYVAGMILSVIFILSVGHEIPAFFVNTVSRGSSKSLRHFLLISALYMLTLFATYMHEAQLTDWDIFVDPYLLLAISSALGIWGFQQRRPLYENIIPYSNAATMAYLAMGIIAFTTIAHLLGTGNDPALKVFRDAIIYSHIGYGLVFILYVLSNFVLMLGQNLPVYQVLYKPNRMPYFTFRLAGLIVVLGFVFYSNWRILVYHGVGGFYNSIGDLYVMLDKPGIAEAYYTKANAYAVLNRHANYALAKINAGKGDFIRTASAYEDANHLRPTPFSEVNEGNIYLNRDPFKSISVYRDGLSEFPGSGELLNNLAYAYARTHRVDSALTLLESAATIGRTSRTARINFLALSCQEYLPVHGDSALLQLDPQDPGMASNALALSVTNGQPFTTEINPLRNGQLDLFEATLLNNYIVRHMAAVDTIFLGKALKAASDSINESYEEVLKSVIAMGYYNNHEVGRAFELMSGVTARSLSQKEKYNYIMGLWALEQGNAELSSIYFDYARQQGYRNAELYYGFAVAESGRTGVASQLWAALAQDTLQEDSAIVHRMDYLLHVSEDIILQSPDEDKYAYAHYRIWPNRSEALQTLLQAIRDPHYKALVVLEQTERLVTDNKIERAVKLFSLIDGLDLSDDDLITRIAHAKMNLLLFLRDTKAATELVDAGLTFDKEHLLQKVLYEALQSEARRDTAEARKRYDWLGRTNPYFEEGVIAASRFYEYEKNNTLEAYSILADAIQVNDIDIRLLNAYNIEASRLGLDEYVDEVRERIADLEERR